MKVSTPRTAQDLLGYLAGAWTIERRIDDQYTKQINYLSGTCTFSNCAHGLNQHEAGTLVLPDGNRLSAQQTYIWQDGGDHVFVRFSDLRDFLTLTPGQKRLSAAHLCGADDYRVEMDFSSQDCWNAEWQVGGPRKNYIMTTSYNRVVMVPPSAEET